MSETATATEKVAKPKTEYTDIVMEDGRTVKFPGTRQVDKTVLVDEEAGSVAVRFDFRNGKTRAIGSKELSNLTVLTAIGHGLSQKVGDEWSGVKEIEDIVLTCDEIMDRLRKGEWAVVGEKGDSMAGASIVIQAIVEASGKTIDQVKAFLQGKLDAAKAKGEKLSRQELYASFRNPTSKTGQIIRRLEEEKAAKNSKVNSDDLLAEIGN